MTVRDMIRERVEIQPYNAAIPERMQELAAEHEAFAAEVYHGARDESEGGFGYVGSRLTRYHAAIGNEKEAREWLDEQIGRASCRERVSKQV